MELCEQLILLLTPPPLYILLIVLTHEVRISWAPSSREKASEIKLKKKTERKKRIKKGRKGIPWVADARAKQHHKLQM